MEPWAKRFCALVFVFIALVVSMSVASALISWVYNVRHPVHGPLMTLVLWNNLSAPNIKPIATGLLCWSLAGFLPTLLLFAWLGWQLHDYQRTCWPAPVPPFAKPRLREWMRQGQRRGSIAMGSRFGQNLFAPETASVLVAGPRLKGLALMATLRHVDGPVLVIDTDSVTYKATAQWRAARGDAVVSVMPFGGGHAWNPLRQAWTPHGWDDEALRQLAAHWYPATSSRHPLLASQVRHAFVTLIYALDDVLHGGDEPGTVVSLTDLCRVCRACEDDPDHRPLRMLADHPGLKPSTRDALQEWLALDSASLARVWQELREPLAPFAPRHADSDAVDRCGNVFARRDPRRTTLYLHIPADRRRGASRVIDTFVAQWHAHLHHHDPQARPLVVIHQLEGFGRLNSLTHGSHTLRWLATVEGLEDLQAVYHRTTPEVMRRFSRCVVQAPSHLAGAEAQRAALDVFHDAHVAQGASRASFGLPTSAELMTLRRRQQVITGPGIRQAVLSRTPRYPPPLSPPPHVPGEPMPLPKPLIALVASLMAACTTSPVPINDTTGPNPCGARPPARRPGNQMLEACLGRQRFQLPKNLFNWQDGQDDRDILYLALRWPAMQPIPMGVDFHDDPETYFSTLQITVVHESRRTDEGYRTIMMTSIQPMSQDDPEQRDNPAWNLDMRIKGEPVHGLTPYYANFDKIKAHYTKYHGPNSRASEPENNDDWFVQLDREGIPTTFIRCSSYLFPDGLHIEQGRVIDDIERDGRRSNCTHEFLIPEYKAHVSIAYMRVLLPYWAQFEAHVRALLKNAEVHA
ncbi:hypothetical protein FHW69_000369 [Luteibacter sp. Sphag1AF]|uniref:hypothetical protein n=1 Tax=Luteibacter sp. Sphag1AF TaxID=2587031 RepID=UPI001618EB2F|nr:hypothetical protein [Luteibacter sp. Sphag1AF]MBB3225779.1 hypothetical protein [Luteibacter sp. Sphag1AF]